MLNLSYQGHTATPEQGSSVSSFACEPDHRGRHPSPEEWWIDDTHRRLCLWNLIYFCCVCVCVGQLCAEQRGLFPSRFFSPERGAGCGGMFGSDLAQLCWRVGPLSWAGCLSINAPLAKLRPLVVRARRRGDSRRGGGVMALKDALKELCWKSPLHRVVKEN